MSADDREPHFAIPMPGGRLARVPAAVLERFVTTEGRCVHGDDAGEDEVAVSAHHFSVDATVGAHEWHSDWEFGECEYVDDAGFTQRKHTWHRHPFGTEYAELYEAR